MSQPVTKLYTPDEYLQREDSADYRSEYFNGEIFAMAGASANHDRIAGNVYAFLNNAFENRACEVFSSDMKVKVFVKGVHFYTYPDVSAIPGPTAFDGSRTDTITNPRVIVEVLSPSTRRYDRKDKFALYQGVASLEEYVLIDQNEVYVELRQRLKPKEWRTFIFDNLDTTLDLQSLGVSLSLRRIYSKVQP